MGFKDEHASEESQSIAHTPADDTGGGDMDKAAYPNGEAGIPKEAEPQQTMAPIKSIPQMKS